MPETPVDIPEIAELLGGLQRARRGDHAARVQTTSDHPAWRELADRINATLEAAQRAVDEAQAARREAALARDAALAAARAEAQFLTNVSHELRTPLSSIRSAAEILHDYPDEPAATRAEFAAIILHDTERLTRMIDDILDLGRIQAGRNPWERPAIRIAATLRAAARACAPALAQAGVTLDLDVPDDLPLVPADGGRLKQLWRHLIDNAVKFRGASTRVTLRARAAGDEVFVECEDDGIGIDPAHHERIFRRFYQVSEDLTDKPKGAGLGLAIAREIAARHGGRISVRSAPGRGSTFRVALPVAPTC